GSGPGAETGYREPAGQTGVRSKVSHGIERSKFKEGTMNRWIAAWAGTLIALVIASPPALPCILCQGGKGTAPMRQDAQTAKLVLYGRLANPRVDAAREGGGTTELHIEKTLKSDPWLSDRKVVELPRYVKIDPVNDHFLIFCDIFKGKLDPFRGEQVSADVVGYVQKALALDGKDRLKTLLFYFDYLDHRDPRISGDAFAE